jgi:hypothetical protein
MAHLGTGRPDMRQLIPGVVFLVDLTENHNKDYSAFSITRLAN